MSLPSSVDVDEYDSPLVLRSLLSIPRVLVAFGGSSSSAVSKHRLDVRDGAW